LTCTRDVGEPGSQLGFGNGFALIALAMFVVVVSVGVFGPRTHGLTLEQISD